ncbi:MAG: retroviral-like aspartic protease family protein [Sphingomonadaceae bacterium]|nr:retroviral-like aspartic protease family protein [Sphingomonadaceae bacterium]
MAAELTPHLPALHGTAPIVALLIGLFLLLAIARGARALLSLASWALLLGLGALLVSQRAGVDPTFARIASFLHLDAGQEVVGKEVRVRLSPDGHFWVRVRLNGVERRMLVDSGATITALSANTAQAAGLTIRPSLVPVQISTANGRISADTATVADLRLGDIRARNLSVVVSPAFGDINVLGMNFLSMLKSWRVEDGTLVMTPHHPQDAA